MKISKEEIIITIYVIVEEICKKIVKTPAQKQKLSDAEVITIAISSALFFGNNHSSALGWLCYCKFFRCMLSHSRFNRRLHAVKLILEYCFEKVAQLQLSGECYISDSMPLPVCKRVRASRNQKVRGREFCGFCAAKQERFFGFRLHLVVTPQGTPVSLVILPASYHDLTPIYEISEPLARGSTVIGDKAYSSNQDETALLQWGIRLMPQRKHNQKIQWSPAEQSFLLRIRHIIETCFSILSDMMGLNSLHAVTLDGFFIKVYAATFALWMDRTFNH